MRRLIVPMLLGLAVLGTTLAAPSQARASWLSESLESYPVQVNVAPTVGYYPPAYAPVQPYPSYYAPSYYAPPYRAYAPAPIARPLPVYGPIAPGYGRPPIERYPYRSEYRGYEPHRDPYRRW
jgi:hypothetical protein